MTAAERQQGIFSPLHLVHENVDVPNPIIIPSREEVAARARGTDPEMSSFLDYQLGRKIAIWHERPTKRNETRLKKAIAERQVFLYLRGTPVYLKNGDRDTENAPNYRMSPNTSLQMLQAARINRNDIVADFFSGVNGLTIPASLCQPKELYAIDEYTPDIYDLERTFTEGMEYLFQDIPQKWRLEYTKPTFIKRDAKKLEKHEVKFTVVLADPPYGREYAKFYDMAEADGFRLWIQSLTSITEFNLPQSIRSFSVVPIEWVWTLLYAIEEDKRRKEKDPNAKFEFIEANDYLNALLHKNKYYIDRDKVDKIRDADKIDPVGWADSLKRVDGFKFVRVAETRMFEMAIVENDELNMKKKREKERAKMLQVA